MLRNYFAIITILLAISVYAQDGLLVSWGPQNLAGMTKERFDGAKVWGYKEVLERNLKTTSWTETYLLVVAAKKYSENKEFLRALTQQCRNQETVPLTDTGRLIIWDRVSSGEITFEGQGLVVSDDLFSVAGRANWILRTITGKNFGYIPLASSQGQAEVIAKKWTDWFGGSPVEEVKGDPSLDSFAFRVLASKEALGALVASLAPNEKKDAVTKKCLKDIYHLDKLPTEPGAPGRLCNPDHLTFTYLDQITEVAESHDWKWWRDWWSANKDKLVWSVEKNKYVMPEVKPSPSP